MKQLLFIVSLLLFSCQSKKENEVLPTAVKDTLTESIEIPKGNVKKEIFWLLCFSEKEGNGERLQQSSTAHAS